MSVIKDVGQPVGEAVHKVREYYQFIDAGEVPRAVALFAPDAVYCRPGYSPLRGRADLTRFYEGDRIIESGTHTLVEVVADLPGVAVRGRFAGRLKDGREVALQFADFFVINDDLLFTQRDTYFYTPMV